MRFLSTLFKRNAKPRRKTGSRRRLTLERLEDRSLQTTITINPSTDPGSTTSSAYNLPAIKSSDRYVVTEPAGYSDPTDYYKFSVPANGRVNLSLTGFGLLNLHLELRNSTGREIARSNARGSTPDSLEPTLSQGTYYVAVVYAGGPSLYLYDYTLTISAGSNWTMISGDDQIHHVGIIRADGNSSITRAVDSWLLIHGKDNRPDPFLNDTGLAKAVASPVSGSGVSLSRVLAVDWETATATGRTNFSNPWIIKAGAAVARMLSDYSITGSRLNIIGHSWGALLGYEIGRAVGGSTPINRFVALDPASQAFGYDDGRVNFAAISTWSWALISSQLEGGLNKASTADESFTVIKDSAADGIGHSQIVPFFADLLSRSDSITSEFKLSKVKDRKLLWKLNQYYQNGFQRSGGVFEVVLSATMQNNVWKLSSLRYIPA